MRIVFIFGIVGGMRFGGAGAIAPVTGRLRPAFEGRTVAVVGAGHSAIGTLLALADLPDTTIGWVLRAPNPDRAYGGGEADALPARGAIGTRVQALVDAGNENADSPTTIRRYPNARFVFTSRSALPPTLQRALRDPVTVQLHNIDSDTLPLFLGRYLTHRVGEAKTLAK